MPALNVEIAPEAAADPPPLPATGNHGLEVQVLDRFGAPLAGVEVKLDGVVSAFGARRISLALRASSDSQVGVTT